MLELSSIRLLLELASHETYSHSLSSLSCIKPCTRCFYFIKKNCKIISLKRLRFFSMQIIFHPKNTQEHPWKNIDFKENTSKKKENYHLHENLRTANRRQISQEILLRKRTLNTIRRKTNIPLLRRHKWKIISITKILGHSRRKLSS